MSSDTNLVSKVLILDNAVEHFDQIKQFCDDNGLIGLRIHSNNVLRTLNSYVDLGGILMAEDYAGTLEKTIELASSIRATRPELPIIMRRNVASCAEALPEKSSKCFVATYTIDDLSPLHKFIEDYIFSVVYPNALIRGITEISVQSLQSQFKSQIVTANAPYIVRDRIIFGEVFSLIPLESNWCRGYMMLQTEESILDSLVVSDVGIQYSQTPFRELNNLLGEVTNLIWGAFKNRFINEEIDRANRSVTQVPLVINHQNKYISFGSENPQLCFKYTLLDEATGLFCSIYQWFIFNLDFTPELFEEIQTTVDDLIDSGELELF
ncbi:MAG: chemotaxis protein CheX [Methylococcaceae bacterium]